MAEIKTSLGGYKAFINDMRAAFRGGVPYVAVYDRGGTFTRFHYVVQPGAVANLYLTSITNAATANGPPTAQRVLAAGEISYGGAALGDMTKATFDSALAANYCVANWPGPLKKSFDIVLLCTVEAARSKYIYKQINEMLNGKSVSADHIKEVAQVYSHTQTAAGVTSFKPLDTLDYRAQYINEKERGTNLATYTAMGL